MPSCCLSNQALTGIPVNIYEGNQPQQTGISNALKRTSGALHGRKGSDAARTLDSHKVGFGKRAKVFWHLTNIDIQKEEEEKEREKERERERDGGCYIRHRCNTAAQLQQWKMKKKKKKPDEWIHAYMMREYIFECVLLKYKMEKKLDHQWSFDFT